MNDCSVSQDGQPLCINGGADLRDLDLKHVPKVHKHNYGLASPPVVPFVLEKPTAKAILIRKISARPISPCPSPLVILPLDNNLLVLDKGIKRTVLL